MPSRGSIRRRVQSANNVKGRRNRFGKNKDPIYRAKATRRAQTLPTLRFLKGSPKAIAFNQIVNVLENQLGKGRTQGEKQNCLKFADNFCSKHDLELEDVLLEMRRRKNKLEPDGSYILIQRTDGRKDMNVQCQAFMIDLCDGIEKVYECDAYTSKEKGQLRVVFYGIPENTVRAQSNFLSAYNTIMEKSMNCYGQRSRNSYCLGAGDAVQMLGERRKRYIQTDIERAEQASGRTFVNDNDEDGSDEKQDEGQVDIDRDAMDWWQDIGDMDESDGPVNQLIRREEWIEEKASLAIRQALREEMSDIYLEKKKIKVHKIRKHHKIIRDPAAYERGYQDGLDLLHDQKRIEAALAEDPREREVESDDEDDQEEGKT